MRRAAAAGEQERRPRKHERHAETDQQLARHQPTTLLCAAEELRHASPVGRCMLGGDCPIERALAERQLERQREHDPGERGHEGDP